MPFFQESEGSFPEQIARATRELEAFNRALAVANRSNNRGASGGGGGAGPAAPQRGGGFARNALRGGLVAAGAFALRTGRNATLNQAEFGQQGVADVARAASIIDPRLQNKIEPIDRAADRVASITENIARFGGQVTDEQRERLFGLFNRQESDVQRERQAIARLANNGIATASGGSAAAAKIERLLEKLEGSIERIAAKLEKFL